MSEMQHTTKQRPEHGTVTSYVIGFALSLVFTLIPYYLVVNKTVSGNVLLGIILGFALLQMLIQIAFFLHWGRGPKPNWNLFFFASTFVIVLFVVLASVLIIHNLRYNMLPSEQTKRIINDEGIYQIDGQPTGACQGQHDNYQIIIKNGQLAPSHTDARRCDTLTFINQDGGSRTIVFGSYPNSQSYAGENNLSVRKGQNQTITLSETGDYQFYDQTHTATTGAFTVNP